MALILSYLIDSFKNPLPWEDCKEEWVNCFPSGRERMITNQTSIIGQSIQKNYYYRNDDETATKLMSSSEYYFM